MGLRNTLLLLLLTIAFIGGCGSSTQPTEKGRVNQVVYITMSKACGCILERCQAGDWIMDRVFVGKRQGLLKRIDYSTEKATAREYIGKYRMPLPPTLLFLDAQGNLIWRADGEMDLDLVLAKLKEFGA
jgi:hypothetical protein